MQLYGPEYHCAPRDTRILIVGVSGSGKTTLARRISAWLDADYVEIDSLFHGPNWEPRKEFLHDVEQVVSNEHWAIEWQYSSARSLLAQRATTAIWLDLPTSVSMKQLWKRTWQRWRYRQVLWNGNREPGPLMWIQPRGENILWWGWTTRNKYRDAPAQLRDAGAPEDLVIVRLASPEDVSAFADQFTE